DSDGTPVVPWGTLTIEETKAPDGYKIEDSTVSVNGQVLSNRIYFTRVSDKDGEQPSKVVTDFTVSDPAKKYGIQVWKVDKELDKSEAIGGKDHKISETGTTLEGVQFSIINRSATAIKYGDKTVNPGEEVTKITTSWNSNLKKYTAQTDERTLPYGTYGVQEISSSQGYKMTDGTEKTVVCHGADGTMYTPDLDANLKFPNQVVRGDYSVRKKSDEGKSISAAFKVTNEATGETHVIVTDANGEFDSTDNKHSKNTNANDKLLKGYTKDTVLKSSDFDLDAGVWFGQGEDGSVAKADDSLGAFYYGKYKIEELRSDSNKGLKLISTDFTITKDGKKINGGTLTDESEPSIGTKAKDEATGTNVASATDDVTIIDTVNYEHLDRGKYKLTAVLMDKATKAAILDKDG
ncbi:SpaA isopeptide-forming pilin-related protein, partial [Anaerostipes hadrus]